MITVAALEWQQQGIELTATVNLVFAADPLTRVYLGGSIGGDYFDAAAVDINGYQLAAAQFLTVNFQGQPRVVAAGAFHTYNLPRFQRYLDFVCTSVASVAVLTFYTTPRREWR